MATAEGLSSLMPFSLSVFVCVAMLQSNVYEVSTDSEWT